MTRAALVWSKGKHLKLAEVQEDADTLIGQAPAAAVTLHDEAVSWRQAKLTRESGAFYLEHLSETYPTKVNKRAIKRRVQLLDGAAIDVGKVRLTFCNITAADRPSGPVCPICHRENSGNARHCWYDGQLLVRIRGKPIRKRRAVVCRFVSTDGRFYDIHGGGAFVIDVDGAAKKLLGGRLPKNKAALAQLRRGKPILVALASDVPVTLNGDVPSKGHALKTGDEIRAGAGHFIVIVR